MQVPSKVELNRQLVRYQQLRAVGRLLCDQIITTIPKAVIKKWATKLAMVDGNVIAFESEDEVAILLDTIIQNSRKGGKNLAGRFGDATLREPGTDTSIVLAAMEHARFMIIQVMEPCQGYGMVCKNIFTREEFFLFDVNFSKTAEKGTMLCGRILRPDGICMTTGASLPIFEEAGRFIEEAIVDYQRRNPKHLKDLNPEEEAEFSTLVIRACRKAHASTRIMYK